MRAVRDQWRVHDFAFVSVPNHHTLQILMKTILCAVVLFCFVLIGQAAPPSDQSISQMMTALQIEKMVDQFLTQMDTGMKTGMEQSLQQSLHGKEATAAQKTAMENFRQKINGTMKEELSFGKLKDLYL